MKRKACTTIVSVCLGSCIGLLFTRAIYQQDCMLLIIAVIAVIGCIFNVLGINAED